MTDLRPGDQVRATVEATVVETWTNSLWLKTADAIEWSLQPGENWSFEVISRAAPRVGDVLPRDDIEKYDWNEGAVIRAVGAPAPIYSRGGRWKTQGLETFPLDFLPNESFEVLAVAVNT